ncbi:hypothetical protein QBZ16_001473 [Prototheca wickerhamii]|uniref:Uncharacterized protein n=1 Tax=Prototheca wickerhamii TaxID=3111 RepID=A0AAD9IGH5_PROWI|nr:hypothetical protein QBZ16_001473 [Prototheca wickerhamii]
MSCPSVLHLLLGRETGLGACHGRGPTSSAGLDSELERWVEDDMVEHTSSDYVTFQPPPRSTIAVAYNSDGSLLASSHGDHTVKITCCKTHRVLRSLTGHRRTPWAVRFHPRLPHLVASGSLDNEVRLWNARTGECFLQHTFGKPIASLSFHTTSHVLGVACGHKVYIWEYGHALSGRVGAELGAAPVGGSESPPSKGPVIVLRTHRSVRAVAFHPAGEGLLLSAEVQNPTATPGLEPSRTARRAFVSRAAPGRSTVGGGEEGARAASDAGALMFSFAPGSSPDGDGAEAPLHDPTQGDTAAQTDGGALPEAALGDMGWLPPDSDALPQSMVPLGWELPFPSASDRPSVQVAARLGLRRAREGQPPLLQHVLAAFSAAAWNFVGEEQPARVRLRVWRFDVDRPAAALASELFTIEDAVLCSEMGVSFSPCGRYLAGVVACRSPVSTEYGLDAVSGRDGSLSENEEVEEEDEYGGGTAVGGDAARGGVAARRRPGRASDASPDASGQASDAPATTPPVLLERGASLVQAFLSGGGATGGAASSPAAPPGNLAPLRVSTGRPAEAHAAASPATPPPAPQAVVYEVRVFSLQRASFGSVLLARRVHAAHCLTTVQFSPCSRHLLLAYGKRHFSLLRSLLLERTGLRPLHTILEIVSLADARLRRVLPSSEDEINAACWHPQAGCGIAYGTKEGRLRFVEREGAGGGGGGAVVSGPGPAHPATTAPDAVAPLSPFEPPGSDVLLSYVAQLAAVPAAVLREPLQAILRARGRRMRGPAPRRRRARPPRPSASRARRGRAPARRTPCPRARCASPWRLPEQEAAGAGPRSGELRSPASAPAAAPGGPLAGVRGSFVGAPLEPARRRTDLAPLRVAIDDSLLAPRADRPATATAWPVWPLFDGERWEERPAPTGARFACVAAFAERVLERLAAECLEPHEPVEPLLLARRGADAPGPVPLDAARVREALLPAVEAVWPPPEFVTPDVLASWAAYGRTYGIDPRWHWTCRWFWWTMRAWLESGGPPARRPGAAGR